MAEEIAFENGRISKFEGLVTLTLILDRTILHTVVHHLSTSTYTPNFIEIEETFCGRADGHLRPALLGRLCRRVNLKHLLEIFPNFMKVHSQLFQLSRSRADKQRDGDKNRTSAQTADVSSCRVTSTVGLPPSRS